MRTCQVKKKRVGKPLGFVVTAAGRRSVGEQRASEAFFQVDGFISGLKRAELLAAQGRRASNRITESSARGWTRSHSFALCVQNTNHILCRSHLAKANRMNFKTPFLLFFLFCFLNLLFSPVLVKNPPPSPRTPCLAAWGVKIDAGVHFIFFLLFKR